MTLITEVSAEERPLAILEKIIQRTNYFTYLSTNFDRQEAEAKIDNVKELLRAVAHFEQQGMRLDEFLMKLPSFKIKAMRKIRQPSEFS